MELPEPFRRALAAGDVHSVCDDEVRTPLERFARALARAQAGRTSDARADFEAVRARFPDETAVELALIAFSEQEPHEPILADLDAVLGRAEVDAGVRARALHVKGRVLAKQPDSPRTLACLVQALDAYRALGQTAKQGEVYDTLGMVHAFDGRIEAASGYYALAIVRKVLGGDRGGAAITLGNLGRLQLRAGRFREALECFELDLEIARTMGDLRGQARMLNDIGRARLALGDEEGAIASLEACIESASAQGFDAVAAFACKDLALALVTGAGKTVEPERQRRAVAAVRRGRRLLRGREDAFASALLTHAEGMVEAAHEKAAAVEHLAQAVRELEALGAPDFEIPALLDLATVLAKLPRPRAAEQCLSRALHLAQREGHARYLAPIRELMEELALPGGAEIEEGHLDLGPEGRPLGGRYTALEKLGAGSFGDVYRALDVYRNREVALKLLRLEDIYDADQRRALFASIRVELDAASRVRHPGIASVYAVGTDDRGGTYVTQEYIAGEPLEARMRDTTRAGLDEVLRGVRDIADALQALHDAGVVHRDLKPANVMIRPDGRPVLIDMGVAYVPSHPAALSPGALVGTFAYMAPEQTSGKGIDGRADVYSLGVVLYEWLTGFHPLRLPSGDFAGVLKAIRKERPIPLAELRDGLPVELLRLADAMLSKTPRQRPSARAVARGLDAILKSSASSASSTSSAGKPQRHG